MIIISYAGLNYEHMERVLVRSVLKNTPYRINVEYLNPQGLEGEELRSYYSMYRSEMCLRYIKQGEDVLYLDADSIVRGDISQLERWMQEGYHTGAVFTPEMGQPGSCNYWLTSTVLFKACPEAQKFAEICIENQKKNGVHWYSAQQAYVDAIEQCKPWIKVKDIGYEYSDKFMRDETPIWEFQGDRKTHPRALEEMAKYGTV